MKILTGNDLKSGAVTWWDGVQWSLHVSDAVDVGDNADAILAREQAARASTLPMRSTRSRMRTASAPPTSRTASARSGRPCAPT
jgi:hypothetical protein